MKIEEIVENGNEDIENLKYELDVYSDSNNNCVSSINETIKRLENVIYSIENCKRLNKQKLATVLKDIINSLNEVDI